MRRRIFLAAAAAWPTIGWTARAVAQSKRAPVVIGWLSFGSPETGAVSLAAFKEGLAALGWKEGAQVVIEARWAEGRADRVDALAAELAARKPAVMVGVTLRMAAALNKAAPTTPIVQIAGANPVTAGLAASFARPGGMVTGLTGITDELSEKAFEFLVAAMPKLRRPAVLIDRNAVNFALQTKAVQRAAARHALDVRFAEVGRAEEIEAALAKVAKEGTEALVVTASPMLTYERRRILKLAAAYRWPVLGGVRAWADDGALLSYGIDPTVNPRRAAYYVDRILKGTKPGDLPIEQPRQVELTINRKTATALGITVPQELLMRADKVIE